MSNLNQLNNLIISHLKSNKLYSEETLWRIENSAVSGRGLFATRDIIPGEIIFIDYPVLIGPRAGINCKLHCVICAKLNNLQACSNGCGLPICSNDCQNNKIHAEECEFIRRLSQEKLLTDISLELFRSLTPLRSFLLNNDSKDLIKSLACHLGKNHGFEIDLVKKYLNLNETEEHFMKIVCSVLDSNAFESVLKTDNNNVSVRGLYPLSSLLNHCCNPNTTHLFNCCQQMIVKATVFIPKGKEIFTTYTSLLWGTSLRRHFLYVTKHFWCHCNRCKDPKEFGSGLSGLKCNKDDCKGIIYPVEPLNMSREWSCDICNDLISSNIIGMRQSILGSLINSADINNMGHLITLIKDKINNIVSVKNHIVYELKLKIIWALGHNEKYLWKDLTIEQICFKEQICKDILDLLSNLKLGKCKMRGLILFELYQCRLQQCFKTSEDSTTRKDVKEINRALLEEAAEILENDVTAPPEITSFINSKKFIIA